MRQVYFSHPHVFFMLDNRCNGLLLAFLSKFKEHLNLVSFFLRFY